MSFVFLSIGSNIEPEKNIPACLQLLKKKFPSVKTSPVYETDPVGPAGRHKFWNLAAQIETSLDRKTLVEELRKVENELGRRRDPDNKFLPRSIDIDILPQTDYQQHAFIMIPLADIAPETEDPETGKTFKGLAEKLEKESVRRVAD